MNYPRMAVPRAYTVSVDRLDGGLDLSFPPERVEDNRLTACDNVYFKDGFLRTRPGFYTDEDRVLSNDRSVEEIRRRRTDRRRQNRKPLSVFRCGRQKGRRLRRRESGI
jgi:hypothetical protein